MASIPSSTRTIRPIGVYALQGLAFQDQQLLSIDAVRGFLVQIDGETDNTTILNPLQTHYFVDATGLALWQETVWFTQHQTVYTCSLACLDPTPFVTLPYPIDGIAVWESTVYVSCQKAGYIWVLDGETGRRITRFPTPGIGAESLAVQGECLWVCDRLEQTVYCLDRATGGIQLQVLTPFDSPTGIAVCPDPPTHSIPAQQLYITYASEEPYIRDDPNSEDPHQLTFRDRTFIHPLYFHHNQAEHYALSNGYLLEMSYVEELLPLDEIELKDLEWRIALPAETPRQKVRHVEPIGLPFTEEIIEGQRVALFKFDTLNSQHRHLFGWKAQLEVHGIKYLWTPRDVEKAPALSQAFQDRYLVDDDELAMDTPVIQAAARAAIGTETNLLRKMLNIRNYVYDRLSYGIRPHIDTPDIALERGVGSCGEYVGVLLALARLNGIACRTVGRYKCPPHAEQKQVPLQPDFNHVWLEFYLPGYGWLPMESNVDDVGERGPYPTRFFMGLPWYHIEMAKGVKFETIKYANQPASASPRAKKGEAEPRDSSSSADSAVSLGDLSINHVRFTILEELLPPEPSPWESVEKQGNNP